MSLKKGSLGGMIVAVTAFCFAGCSESSFSFVSSDGDLNLDGDTETDLSEQTPSDGDDDLIPLPDGDVIGEKSEEETDAEEEAQSETEEDWDPPSPPGLEGLRLSAFSGHNIAIRWAPLVGDGTVIVERYNDDAGDWDKIAQRPAAAGRFLDLALTPETPYRYRLTLCDDGCREPLVTETVSTPPTTLPPMTVNVHEAEAADDLVLFGAVTTYEDVTSASHVAAVDKNGVVWWEFTGSEGGAITEVQPLDDRTLAIGQYMTFVRLDLDGRELFRYGGALAHHDIDPVSDGRFIYLTFDEFETQPGYIVSGDGIEILGADGRTVEWSWLARDHIPLSDYNLIDINTQPFGLGHDWTHANALTYDETENKVYINVRNLDRIYKIDVATGGVDWIMGDGGDFGEGLWAHSHNPHFFFPENRFLLFDNGFQRGDFSMYSRVIEVVFDPEAKTAEIVWEYREDPDFYSFALGSVEQKLDGTILVDDGLNGRLFEISREKRKLWELKLGTGYVIYKGVSVDKTFFTEW
ncbi:MAG: hypothetical protein C4523_04230 [Myxococcales bacterium]|nr:MAG: hypothetical protein C4523_04230 [Myxococcales bacterium]